MFNGTTDFSGSKFNGTAYFYGAMFNKDAKFLHSTFNGGAYFYRIKFNGSVDFRYSKFNEDATFLGSFKGAAYFSDSDFKGPVDFERSKFNRTADFSYTKFSENAYLSDSKFNGTADFSGSKFNGTADFYGSKFNVTDFTEAQFDKVAQFDDTQFTGIASFNNSRFKEDALFENTTFKNVLYLTRTKYDKFYIRWASIKKRLGYDESAYQQLIENFKKLGYSSDVDNSYYQFRKAQFLHRKLIDDPLVYISDLGAWESYGFGKRPIFPLVWSAFFVLFFGGIWMALGSKKSENTERNWPGSIENALSFSFTVFLSGTGKLFVDVPAVPEIPGRSELMIKRIFNIERLLGAFFSIMFFLAITGMVLKSV